MTYWRKSVSLKQKMTATLLAVVLVSLVFTGVVILLGNAYMSRFNTVLNDCYDINQLLTLYNSEADSYQTYVLYGGESLYSDYLTSRSQATRALEQVQIDFEDSQEQYLLRQAVETSYTSFRAVCDDVVLKRVSSAEYADVYDRSLRMGEYIEGYIKNLLQLAIGQGQETYQRNQAQFRVLPVIFVLGVVLALSAIIAWTNWMVKKVVSPINALIAVTGEMSKNHYDAPDVPVDADDEIAQLTLVVNEMKHSTGQLVDSLQAQRDMEQRLHNEEVRRMRIETTMDTLRLSLLQSQVNPHFLFNTLNIISRMAQMENAAKTEDLIVRLSSLFRYNLRSVDDIVPLENELKIVQDYIAIQQIRFGERILFDLACDLDPKAYRVPVFTLQPLIENAVIHGISPMEEGGKVTVEIAERDGMLAITVADTGVGMSPERIEQLLAGDDTRRKHVSGLGLGNVQKRLLAHYVGSTFTIDSELGGGTKIAITIPLTMEETDHA